MTSPANGLATFSPSVRNQAHSDALSDLRLDRISFELDYALQCGHVLRLRNIRRNEPARRVPVADPNDVPRPGWALPEGVVRHQGPLSQNHPRSELLFDLSADNARSLR